MPVFTLARDMKVQPRYLLLDLVPPPLPVLVPCLLRTLQTELVALSKYLRKVYQKRSHLGWVRLNGAIATAAPPGQMTYSW